MTPLVRRFARAYARQLIEIAEKDLHSARVLGKDTSGRKETTIFMVQQAVEKSLKAVICHMGKPVPMIHDISGLLVALPLEVLRPPEEEGLDGLTEFATVRRYEEGFAELSSQEIDQIICVGDRVVSWAKEIVAPTKEGS